MWHVIKTLYNDYEIREKGKSRPVGIFNEYGDAMLVCAYFNGIVPKDDDVMESYKANKL